jgi:CubicO group peptidase (beta-lactamase class C family)
MPETWAVIDNGAVVEAHDAHLPAPWWSFTKTVLSAAALVLVRDGVLALDEALPDRPYTLRHLLQHRSGLANYGEVPGITRPWREATRPGRFRRSSPTRRRTGFDRLLARGGSIPTSAISSCAS